MPTEGQTASNPQTGERLIFRGGVWSPMGGDQQPQSSSFPGIVAAPPKRPDPYQVQKDQQQQATEEARLGIALRGDARATQDQAMQAERFNLDKQKLEMDRANLTETQGKATAFAKRAQNALSQYDSLGLDPDSMIGNAASFAMPRITAALSSDKRNTSRAAEREFIAAILRYDSGAAIPDSEYANAYQIYFPSSSAGPEEIAAKAKARRTAFESLLQSAGRGAERVVGGDEAKHQQEAAGVPPGYEVGFQDQAPPPDAGPYRMSGQNEAAYRAFVESQKGNPNFTADMANRFLASLNEQPISPEQADGFVQAVRAGTIQTSGVDYSAGDMAYQAQVDARAKERDTAGGAVDAAVRGFADTATVGLADKISAAITTLGSGGTYADNLAQERITNAADAQSNPWTRLGGQVGGAVALPMSRAAGTGRMMAEGAGYGGAYAFNSSDAPMQERLGQTLVGTGLGALGGAGASGLNALLTAAPRYARPGRNALAGEVAQNADVIAAGQRQGVNVRLPDVAPSKRADYSALEASPTGNALVGAARQADEAAIQGRVQQIGGAGTPQENFALGDRIQGAMAGIKKAATNPQTGYFPQAYARVERLAPGHKAAPTATVKAIDDRIAQITAASPEGAQQEVAILERMKRDFQATGVTTESVKAQRQRAREALKGAGIDMNAADAALSDITRIAGQELEASLASNPRAQALLKRTNAEYGEYRQFRDQIAKTFTGTQNAPVSSEMAATRLLGMTKPGGDSEKLRRLMAVLEPDEVADLRATIAQGLGGGADKFSLATLATTLEKKMNPRALREVFGPDGYEALKDLQILSRAKADAGSRFNNSGTAIVQARQNGFRDILLGALGGGAAGVPGAIAGMAARGGFEKLASNRSARLLLNSDVTKWLRNTPNSANPKVINAHFQRLDKIAARTPAIAGDVKVLQSYLMEAFAQSPTRAAAQDEANGRREPIQ